MTHVTCKLTAKNRHQLRNPTLGNRVWATFFTAYYVATVNNGSRFCRGRLDRSLRRSVSVDRRYATSVPIRPGPRAWREPLICSLDRRLAADQFLPRGGAGHVTPAVTGAAPTLERRIRSQLNWCCNVAHDLSLSHSKQSSSSRRHCFTHRTLHHSVQLCDRP